jgi:hypothetical protein
MSSSSANTVLHPLSAALEAALDAETPLPDDVLQEIATVAVRLYAARVEAGGPLEVVAPSSITPTEAMVTISALLRAVNVQLFELGLWQAWAQ